MSPLQTYQGEEPIRFVPASVPKAWLSGPLETFSLCMASHGLCVSSAMMMGDKAYAIQLWPARSLWVTACWAIWRWHFPGS